MVLALHTVSGQVADVSPKMLEHPHFKNFLVPVEEGRKPYLPGMFKGGTVEEKSEMGSSLVVEENVSDGDSDEDVIITFDTYTEEEK